MLGHFCATWHPQRVEKTEKHKYDRWYNLIKKNKKNVK